MGRLFWLLMGVLGVALILLVTNHDSGLVMGIPTGSFAALVALSCWAVFIAGGTFGLQTSWASTIIQIAIWLCIILALMTGYVVYHLYISPSPTTFDGPTKEAQFSPLQPVTEYAISHQGGPKSPT